MLKRMIAMTSIALGLLACSQAWAESMFEVLNKAEQRWAKLYNAKDAAALAKGYVADGMRLPPDASRIRGRPAIEANLQKEFDSGLTNTRLVVTEVGSSGDLAWLMGNFAVDYPGDDGKMTTATGNYVSIYRKEADGVWRTVLDTWNDTPAK